MIKITSTIIGSLIIFFNSMILIGIILDIGELNNPSTIIAPCIAFISLNVSIVLLIRCTFWWEKNILRKKDIYISVYFFIISVLLFPISICINGILNAKLEIKNTESPIYQKQLSYEITQNIGYIFLLIMVSILPIFIILKKKFENWDDVIIQTKERLEVSDKTEQEINSEDSNTYSEKQELEFIDEAEEQIEPEDNRTYWEKELDKIDAMSDGHDFEYYTAELLKKLGYEKVEVTQGSGDFGVDVLAEKNKVKFAIQCKRYSQNVGIAAVQEIYSGIPYYHCHVGVVITNQYFTNAAKEHADKVGVILWDRNEIISMLKIVESCIESI